MAELLVQKDALAAAGRLLGEAIRTRLQGAKSCRFAIPGGSAMKVLAPLRAHLTADEWSRVLLTWVDERCVPFLDPESNRGAAYRAGLLDDASPPALEVPLFFDDETPESARARVLETLQSAFDSRLDVVLLGMGEDGHVASLFPGHPVLRATGGCAVVTDSPKPPPTRLTLTHDLLATAQRTVLVATGEGKRAALVRLLAGDRALPASDLPHLTVVTDLAL